MWIKRIIGTVSVGIAGWLLYQVPTALSSDTRMAGAALMAGVSFLAIGAWLWNSQARKEARRDRASGIPNFSSET